MEGRRPMADQPVTWRGRYFCERHRVVITSDMRGCPRCLAEQSEPTQGELW